MQIQFTIQTGSPTPHIKKLCSSIVRCVRWGTIRFNNFAHTIHAHTLSKLQPQPKKKTLDSNVIEWLVEENIKLCYNPVEARHMVLVRESKLANMTDEKKMIKIASKQLPF